MFLFGGGKDGFRHLDHLGPATKEWTRDMRADAFTWNNESVKLDERVQELMRGADIRDKYCWRVENISLLTVCFDLFHPLLGVFCHLEHTLGIWD